MEKYRKIMKQEKEKRTNRRKICLNSGISRMMKVNSKEFKKWKIKDWQIRKLQVYIDYKNPLIKTG